VGVRTCEPAGVAVGTDVGVHGTCVGVQAETPEELRDIALRLIEAGETTFDEPDATCCYARSRKAWVTDPAGLRWETFYTFGEATVYGEDRGAVEHAGTPAAAACCG
jgi:hypothetical protein